MTQELPDQRQVCVDKMLIWEGNFT